MFLNIFAPENLGLLKLAAVYGEIPAGVTPSCAFEQSSPEGEKEYCVCFLVKDENELRKGTRHDVILDAKYKLVSHTSGPFNSTCPPREITEYPVVYAHSLRMRALAASQTKHPSKFLGTTPSSPSQTTRGTASPIPDRLKDPSARSPQGSPRQSRAKVVSTPTLAAHYVLRKCLHDVPVGGDQDLGITLTFLYKGAPGPDATERLFVNDEEILKECWQWGGDRAHLIWRWPSHKAIVWFAPDGTAGTGTLWKDGKDMAVEVVFAVPTYNCKVSSRVGASIQDGVLQWDSSSPAWTNSANWIDNCLRWRYSIVNDPENPGFFRVSPIFQDLNTIKTWRPDLSTFAAQNGPNTAEFALYDWEFTPDDDRTVLLPPLNELTTLFPYQYLFQFNSVLADSFNGAILVDKTFNAQVVYGVSGTVPNALIVGKYAVKTKTRTILFSVVNEKMFMDGKEVKGAALVGNKMVWNNVWKHPILPFLGEIEFSEDGEKVLSSSLDNNSFISGGHMHATQEEIALAKQSLLALNVTTLLSFNPTDPDYNDSVQSLAMEDFYKIIQYYMTPSLRQTFISANPPDLRPDVLQIAINSTQNAAFYNSLGVPYIANQLATNTDPAVQKLDYPHARKWLSDSIATSTVYQQQANDLYSMEFSLRYPDMGNYLNDQRINNEAHKADIDTEATAWKNQLREDAQFDDATDADAIVNAIDQLVPLAKNQKYWAWKAFNYLVTTYMTNVQSQIISLRLDSKSTSAQIKSYCSILSILDPTNVFANQFIEILRYNVITNFLASSIDFGGDGGAVMSDFYDITIQLLERFSSKYIEHPSTDVQLQEAAIAVYQALQYQNGVRTIEAYMEALMFAALSNSGVGGFGTFLNTAQRRILVTVGTGGAYLMRIVGLAVGSLAMMLMASGNVSFGSMSGEDQGFAITGAITMFMQSIGFLLKKGMNVLAVFNYTGSKWGTTLKYIFTGKVPGAAKGITTVIDSIDSKLAKYLSGKGATSAFVAADSKWALRLLGRNLNEFFATRLAAPIALAGIILSSIELAHSTTPEDKAINSLMLTASILELVGAVAGWVAGSSIVTAAGAANFALVAGMCSALAIVAVIAGIILIFVFAYTHNDPPPTPIHEFVYGPARDAGFFLEHDIDIGFFDLARDADSTITTSGVTLCANGNNNSAIGANVGTDPWEEFTVSGGKSIDNDWDTVLQPNTDSQRNTTFQTRFPTSAAPPVSLTLTSDMVVKFTKSALDSNVKYQQWKTEPLGDVERDQFNNLSAASFNIYSAWKYVDTGLKYYLQANGTVAYNAPVRFRVKFNPMKPGGLSFANIKLKATDSAANVYAMNPILPQTGTRPLTYELSATLPDFFHFDPTTGVITNVTTIPYRITPPTLYTITVRNDYGSSFANFYLEVTAS